MTRNQNWRSFTWEQRKGDWEPHDKIVNCLCRYQNWTKATEEQDFQGIDFWYGNTPYDLKFTTKYPATAPPNLDNYALFIWYLENQDLTRFHNTNRIIVMQDGQPIDIELTALEIQLKIENGGCFENICYRLKGMQGQENHPLRGKLFQMDKGVLITKMLREEGF